MPYGKSKRSEWADLVFEHIPSGPNDVPIGRKDLAALVELTVDQVQNGIDYLRDNLPDLPLLSSREGYIFSIEPDRNAAFKKARAKLSYTVMRRTWLGALKPYLTQASLDNPDAKAAMKLAAKQFERAIEDLAEIVA